MRYIKPTSTIKMPRQSSYQYVYSLLSKHGLYSSFPVCFLLLSSSSPLLQMVLPGLRLLFLRLDTETCYVYDFTLIMRDFKIICLHHNILLQ